MEEANHELKTKNFSLVDQVDQKVVKKRECLDQANW